VGVTAGSREVPGRKPVTRDNDYNNNNNNNNNNKPLTSKNCLSSGWENEVNVGCRGVDV
jgi:hypothetical protein